MSNPPKYNRRWFQFSLRTLMIVVTLLAVPLGYVGWQAKIVRERQTTLAEIKKMGGHFYTREDDFAQADTLVGYRVDRDVWPSDVPWLRRLLGDDHVSSIYLPLSVTAPELERIEDTFPEAVVVP